MLLFNRPLKLLGSGKEESPAKNIAINEEYIDTEAEEHKIASTKSQKKEEKEEELFLLKTFGSQPLARSHRFSVISIDEEEADRRMAELEGRSSDDSFCTDSSGDSILQELEESDLNE